MRQRRDIRVAWTLASFLLAAQLLLSMAAAGDTDAAPVFRVARTWESGLTARYAVQVVDARSGRPLPPARVTAAAIPAGQAEPEAEVRAFPSGARGYRARVAFRDTGWYRVVITYMGSTMTFVAFDERVAPGSHAGQVRRLSPRPGVAEEDYEEERYAWMDPHVPTLSARDWANLWGVVSHLAGSVLLLFGLLQGLRRRSGEVREQRGALSVVFAALALLVGTGLYNWLWNTPAGGPLPLTDGGDAILAELGRVSFGGLYAAILYAKHVLVVVLAASAVALWWRLRAAAQDQRRPPRSAFQLWLNLIAGSLTVLLGATLGFLHRISH